MWQGVKVTKFCWQWRYVQLSLLIFLCTDVFCGVLGRTRELCGSARGDSLWWFSRVEFSDLMCSRIYAALDGERSMHWIVHEAVVHRLIEKIVIDLKLTLNCLSPKDF